MYTKYVFKQLLNFLLTLLWRCENASKKRKVFEYFRISQHVDHNTWKEGSTGKGKEAIWFYSKAQTYVNILSVHHITSMTHHWATTLPYSLTPPCFSHLSRKSRVHTPLGISIHAYSQWCRRRRGPMVPPALRSPKTPTRISAPLKTRS